MTITEMAHRVRQAVNSLEVCVLCDAVSECEWVPDRRGQAGSLFWQQFSAYECSDKDGCAARLAARKRGVQPFVSATREMTHAEIGRMRRRHMDHVGTDYQTPDPYGDIGEEV